MPKRKGKKEPKSDADGAMGGSALIKTEQLKGPESGFLNPEMKVDEIVDRLPEAPKAGFKTHDEDAKAKEKEEKDVGASVPPVIDTVTGHVLPKSVDLHRVEGSHILDSGASVVARIGSSVELFMGDQSVTFTRRRIKSFGVEIPDTSFSAGVDWSGNHAIEYKHISPVKETTALISFPESVIELLSTSEVKSLKLLYARTMLPIEELVLPNVDSSGISSSSKSKLWQLLGEGRWYDINKYTQEVKKTNLFISARRRDYAAVAGFGSLSVARCFQRQEFNFPSCIDFSIKTLSNDYEGDSAEAGIAFPVDDERPTDTLIPTLTSYERLSCTVGHRYHLHVTYHDVAVLLAYQHIFGESAASLPYVVERANASDDTEYIFQTDFAFDMPCGVGAFSKDENESRFSVAHKLQKIMYDLNESSKLLSSFNAGLSAASTYILPNPAVSVAAINNSKANREAVNMMMTVLSTVSAVTYARVTAAMRSNGRGMRLTIQPLSAPYVPHFGVLVCLINFMFAEVEYISIASQVMLLSYIAENLATTANPVTGARLREALLENPVAPSQSLLACFGTMRVLNPGKTPMQAAMIDLDERQRAEYARILHAVYFKVGRDYLPVSLSPRFALPTHEALHARLIAAELRRPNGELIDWTHEHEKVNMLKAMAMANMHVSQHREREVLYTMGVPPQVDEANRRVPGTRSVLTSYAFLSREDYYGEFNLGYGVERSSTLLRAEDPNCDAYIASLMKDVLQFASVCSAGLGGTVATWMALNSSRLREGLTAVDTFGYASDLTGYPFDPVAKMTVDAPVTLAAHDALSFLMHGATAQFTRINGESGLALPFVSTVQLHVPMSIHHSHIMLSELRTLAWMLRHLPSARRPGLMGDFVADYQSSWLNFSDTELYRRCCKARVELYLSQHPEYIMIDDLYVHDGASPRTFIEYLPIYADGNYAMLDPSVGGWLYGERSSVLPLLSGMVTNDYLNDVYDVEQTVDGSVGMFYFLVPQIMSTQLVGVDVMIPEFQHEPMHCRYVFGANHLPHSEAYYQPHKGIFDPAKTAAMTGDIYSLREDPVESRAAMLVLGGPLMSLSSYRKLLKFMSSNGKEAQINKIDLTEEGIKSLLGRVDLEVRRKNFEMREIDAAHVPFTSPIGVYIHASTKIVAHDISGDLSLNPEDLDHECDCDFPSFDVSLDGRAKVEARIDVKLPYAEAEAMKRLRAVKSKIHYVIPHSKFDDHKINELTIDMDHVKPEKGYVVSSNQRASCLLKPMTFASLVTSSMDSYSFEDIGPDPNGWTSKICRQAIPLEGIPLSFGFYCGLSGRRTTVSSLDGDIYVSRGPYHAEFDEDGVGPHFQPIGFQSPVVMLMSKPSIERRVEISVTKLISGMNFSSPRPNY